MSAPVRAQWEARRAAALAARKPNGFELATSFTDKQPMHGWLVAHAIRELWQNLRDGLAETFGDAEITPRFVGAQRVTLATGGEDVAYADWSGPNKLVLW